MAELTEPSEPIAVIDDEVQILDAMRFAFLSAGIRNVKTFRDPLEALEKLKTLPFSLITLDVYMPGMTGLDLIPRIIEIQPETPVIVVTGADEVDLAVRCLKGGAKDFLVKPVEKNRLITSVRNCLEASEMIRENERLRQSLLSGKLKNPRAFSELITGDDKMQALFKYTEAVAPTVLPILITGETGTGKELLAKAVHRASGRKGVFVPVNVAGLDDTLFSDTLFGHVKGAYTGAASEREGMIGKAAGGTLFLDEIGDLAMDSQIKLLRLLQEKEYYPLGTDKPKHTDARFVFATNRPLEKLVAEEGFRKDLFYRLRSHSVKIPPLRERPGDLSLLIRIFLEEASSELGIQKPRIPKEFVQLLSSYNFPGNVRELKGLVYDAAVRYESGTVSIQHFRDMLQLPAAAPEPAAPAAGVSFAYTFPAAQPLPTLKGASDALVEEALARTGGNKTAAAELLGITRSALSKRLSRRPN